MSHELYDEEGFGNGINVLSESRQFQVSIVIKQDVNKSGILTFLKKVEESSISSPTSSPAQTVRPSGGGGQTYNA